MNFDLKINENTYPATASIPDKSGFGVVGILLPNQLSADQKTAVLEQMENISATLLWNLPKDKESTHYTFKLMGDEDQLSTALYSLGVTKEKVVEAKAEKAKAIKERGRE